MGSWVGSYRKDASLIIHSWWFQRFDVILTPLYKFWREDDSPNLAYFSHGVAQPDATGTCSFLGGAVESGVTHNASLVYIFCLQNRVSCLVDICKQRWGKLE